MSNDTPGKTPIVTEDTMVKTNFKTIGVVVTGVVVGTIYFLSVMWQLKEIAKSQSDQGETQKTQYAELIKKIEESESRSVLKINWLFRLLQASNPFEKNSNANDTTAGPPHAIGRADGG